MSKTTNQRAQALLRSARGIGDPSIEGLIQESGPEPAAMLAALEAEYLAALDEYAMQNEPDCTRLLVAAGALVALAAASAIVDAPAPEPTLEELAIQLRDAFAIDERRSERVVESDRALRAAIERMVAAVNHRYNSGRKTGSTGSTH